MDLREFHRRLMERRMRGETQPAGSDPALVQRLGRVKREMILAVLSVRRSDGSEGDFTSLVRFPKAPKPTLNRSAIAIPLDPDSGDIER